MREDRDHRSLPPQSGFNDRIMPWNPNELDSIRSCCWSSRVSIVGLSKQFNGVSWVTSRAIATFFAMCEERWTMQKKSAWTPVAEGFVALSLRVLAIRHGNSSRESILYRWNFRKGNCCETWVSGCSLSPIWRKLIAGGLSRGELFVYLLLIPFSDALCIGFHGCYFLTARFMKFPENCMLFVAGVCGCWSWLWCKWWFDAEELLVACTGQSLIPRMRGELSNSASLGHVRSITDACNFGLQTEVTRWICAWHSSFPVLKWHPNEQSGEQLAAFSCKRSTLHIEVRNVGRTWET